MEVGGSHHAFLEITPVPSEYEAAWAPESVWTFWLREKHLTSSGIWTPGHLVRSLLTIR